MSPAQMRSKTGLLLILGTTAMTAGCGMFGIGDDEPAPLPEINRTSQTPSGSTSMNAPSGSNTTQIGESMVLVSEGTPTSVPLADDAPERYTVKEGDTLWDIAETFLRDPWYWPEVWYINPQIDNPHLIYPGDVLAMVTIGGRQRITNTGPGPSSIATYRVTPTARATPIAESITSIPHEQISSFLSKGVVLERQQAEALPYILSTRGDHLMASAGNEIYIRGGSPSPNGTRFSVVHIGEELRDPDDNDVIGFEGVYVGEGSQSRGGDPATVALTDTNREALAGDRLLPESVELPLNFFPKAPDYDVDGRIISVVDGVSLIGQYQVVVLNRGARNGLAPGDVLSVFQSGEVMRDRWANGSLNGSGGWGGGERVTLPEEQAGTIMVFKVYERIGYALVMEATSDIHVLDAVRNPI